jgi:hypothetical protein
MIDGAGQIFVPSGQKERRGNGSDYKIKQGAIGCAFPVYEQIKLPDTIHGMKFH